MDLFDRAMAQPQMRVAGRFSRVELVHQPPYATQEPVASLYGARIPRLGQFELPHEHFIEPQRIGAVGADHIVGIHAVQLALRHFLDFCRELFAG